MQVNNCGTCRFWGPDDDWRPEGYIPERYEHESDEQYTQRVDWTQTRFKTCKKVVFNDRYGEIPQAYVIDASCYSASLHTLESFGCNLWEAT